MTADSLAYPPRGFSRDEAARYIGVGATTFDAMVADGRMPKPFNIGKRVIWDRLKIEASFAALGDQDAENSIDRELRLVHTRR